MSATLRHDIPLRLAAEIGRHSLVLNALGAYEASRWAGVRHGYNRVMTFAIKLPTQIGEGHELLRTVCLLACAAEENATSKAAWTLARKLIVSFGLPFTEELGQPCDEEKAFLAAIEAGAADTTAWSAYSDWLIENGSDLRGRVIAEWIDAKKPVKTKYGIPVSVRHKLKR